MILVIGGYAAGKLDFAKECLGVTDYDDASFGNSDCVYRLDKMVDCDDFDENLSTYLKAHPDSIIICNEIGGGIVPMDKSDRVHREKTGRVCCQLAKNASAVYRVFCGIGTRIK